MMASHLVIIALQDWYGSADTSTRTIFKSYQQKMEALSLDKNVIAHDYESNLPGLGTSHCEVIATWLMTVIRISLHYRIGMDQPIQVE
jgi:hypothetical protein